MINMGELLEEQIQPLSNELFKRNHDRARAHYNHPGQPAMMYTIEYMKAGKVAKWACIAHGWSWRDRHKIFYCCDAGGTRHTVAEFYCDKKDFVSQKVRRAFE